MKSTLSGHHHRGARAAGVLSNEVRDRISEMVRAAEAMMQEARAHQSADEIELEVRLRWDAGPNEEEEGGNMCSSSSSSLPLDMFEAIYSKFPLTEEERNTMPWFTDLGIMQVCDYIWTQAPNGAKKGRSCAPPIRDRVFFEPFGSTTGFGGEVKQCAERSQKITVSKYDFKCASLPECLFRVALSREKRYSIEGPIGGGGGGGSISEEEEEEENLTRSSSSTYAGGAAAAVTASSLSYEDEATVPPPTSVETTLVRIKHTHSFLYTSRYMWEPAWKFIFSQCWSGSTRSEAERRFAAMQTQPDTCEIEIELLHPIKYRNCVDGDGSDQNRRQYDIVAESMVRKIISLYLPVEEESQIEVPHVASSRQRDEETMHCASVFRLVH